MLFDLYDVDKKLEYNYWVKKVHQVATVLGYDYFKLWELPEHEFEMLAEMMEAELEAQRKKINELKDSNK